MKVRLAMLMMMLVACGHRAPSDAEVLQLPRTQSLVSGDFNLRVSRNGEMFWNGVPISVEDLKTYAHQVDAMARLRIVVQFEGDETNPARKAVIKVLTASDTCHQRRCAEATWNAHRPPVVY